MREYLAMALEAHGYGVEHIDEFDELAASLRDAGRKVSAVVSAMPAPEGLRSVSRLRGEHPGLPIVLLARRSSSVTPAEAKESGAAGLLYKPLTYAVLSAALSSALGSVWLENEVQPALYPDTIAPHNVGWACRSEDFVRKAGPSDVPVLIMGETGTGKEVLARRLHARSARAHKPFLKLNCAALPPELVESELFGYERGAFTGAFQKRAGMFEQANGGTLLLDEIGDMDHKLQAKLLHVLQDRCFQPLGGKETVSVDVRVIAATHRNLEEAISDGTFREDLYYRLNVVSIVLPPLRHRRDEILPLAEHFLQRFLLPGQSAPLVPVLVRALLEYDWPGNIRELENRIRSYIVMGDAESLAFELHRRVTRAEPEAGPTSPAPAPASLEGEETSILEQVNRAKQLAEIDAILAVLNSTRWNRKQAATILGIDYKALLYRMKKLNIDDSRVHVVPSRKETTRAEKAASPPQRVFRAGASSGFAIVIAASLLHASLLHALPGVLS